jgi:hypothetical protein
MDVEIYQLLKNGQYIDVNKGLYGDISKDISNDRNIEKYVNTYDYYKQLKIQEKFLVAVKELEFNYYKNYTIIKNINELFNEQIFQNFTIKIIQGSVIENYKNAEKKNEIGIIQDPAGSAVGAPTLSGSGFSGNLYNMFKFLNKKLALIPKIEPTESIINFTDKQIIHTYSPEGSKKYIELISYFFGELYTSYYNVIKLILKQGNLQNYKNTINLTPISGSIYAGIFINTDINHLDPSFTIGSILCALTQLKEESKTDSELNLDNSNIQIKLFYYSKNVFDNAQKNFKTNSNLTFQK